MSEIINYSLSPDEIRSLDEQGELIQRVAVTRPKTKSLEAIDRDLELDTGAQLESLISRVEEHMELILGQEAAQVMSVRQAVDDCEMILGDMNSAIDTQGSRVYTPAERAAIARRSFGVVNSYALDQNMPLDELRLIEEPVAFVVRGETRSPWALSEMPCPAFRGKPTGIPRMPAQLWSSVIDIFQECGEFGAPE